MRASRAARVAGSSRTAKTAVADQDSAGAVRPDCGRAITAAAARARRTASEAATGRERPGRHGPGRHGPGRHEPGRHGPGRPSEPGARCVNRVSLGLRRITGHDGARGAEASSGRLWTRGGAGIAPARSVQASTGPGRASTLRGRPAAPPPDRLPLRLRRCASARPPPAAPPGSGRPEPPATAAGALGRQPPRTEAGRCHGPRGAAKIHRHHAVPRPDGTDATRTERRDEPRPGARPTRCSAVSSPPRDLSSVIRARTLAPASSPPRGRRSLSA